MKKKITMGLLIVFFTGLPIFSIAQKNKVLGAHPDVIQILAEVKKSAENTGSIIKNWNSKTGIASGKRMYENIQKIETGFIARYKVIIQTPKILKQTGENIKSGLNTLVDENNKFLKFCDDNHEKYSTQNNASGVGDIVEGVANVVLKIFEYYRKATQIQKDQFKKEVDEQVLIEWKDIK